MFWHFQHDTGDTYMDSRIYTMTHKTFEFPAGVDETLYLPLHVGRSLGEDLGYWGDDTGESISEKNGSFCELTGMYWVWKNVTCDVVGVAHYRRYFIYGEQNRVLRREELEEFLRDCDFLISASYPSGEGSIYENYDHWHNIGDLAVCRQVLTELYPQDVDAFDLQIGSTLFCGGNLFATSKRIYDEYCNWLFSILFEVEKRVDVSGYDRYQKRLFGFLAERLLRVFVLSHQYRVKELRVGQA